VTSPICCSCWSLIISRRIMVFCDAFFHESSSLGIADISFLVFLENFLGNEGVDMVSQVMVFFHSTEPFHLSSFKREWHPQSSLLGL
jgi:hypothetical protein